MSYAEIIATLTPETGSYVSGLIRQLSEEKLRTEAESQRANTEKQRADLAEMKVKHLELLLRKARIERFGPGSEKLSDTQLELLTIEPVVTVADVKTEAAQPAEEKNKRPATARRGATSLPSHLPRREVTIACSPEECFCQTCQKERTVMGYETSERLNVIPATYEVVVTKREKRVCPGCEDCGVVVAPAPATIIPKGIATNNLIVDVVHNKLELHIPIYRQCVNIERTSGVILSCQTVGDWLMGSGFLIQAVCRCVKTEILATGYVQADETPIGVHNKEKKGKNHRGYLWEYRCPSGSVIYDFRMGRDREGPRLFLGNYNGILQTDGYAAYARNGGGPDIILAGCMAHARRPFF